MFLAHDVGRSRDRSTAVIGGPCPHTAFVPDMLGLGEFRELEQGLFGSGRASAVATVDREWNCDALVFADLSFDPSYAEHLVEVFGERVFGVQITRYGEGMEYEIRPLRNGRIIVYNVGRSYLLEFLHSQLASGRVRFSDGPTHGAPISSSPIWSLNSATPAQSIPAHPVTTTSRSPARSSIGRPIIRTGRTGSIRRSESGSSANRAASDLR